MKTRLATTEDLPRVLELGERFCHETALGWHMDPPLAAASLQALIDGDESEIILVVLRGDIVGFINVVAGRDYCIETFGFIEKFYIAESGRGTVAARTLVKAAIDWFQARGCDQVFATATAAFSPGQDKQFINLFAKFGFVTCGTAIMKEFRNEQV